MISSPSFREKQERRKREPHHCDFLLSAHALLSEQKLSPKDGDPSDRYTLREGMVFQMGGTRLKGKTPCLCFCSLWAMRLQHRGREGERRDEASDLRERERERERREEDIS